MCKATAPTTRVAYIVHSTITVTELFRYIFHELNLDFTAPSKIDYVLALQRFSRQCAGQGERLVLILDEAQNYSHEVLEEIRLLSNIETPQDKLLKSSWPGKRNYSATLSNKSCTNSSNVSMSRTIFCPLTLEKRTLIFKNALRSGRPTRPDVVSRGRHRRYLSVCTRHSTRHRCHL